MGRITERVESKVAIDEAEIDDIAAWNPVTSTITAEASDVHRKQYLLFRKLHDRTTDIAAKLSKPD